MRTMQELRAKRSEAVAAARKLVEDNSASWTDDHETKLNAMYSDIDKIDAEMKRNQKMLDMIAAESKVIDQRAGELGTTLARVQDVAQAESAVMLAFMRGGREAITDQLQQDLQAARQAAGIANTMSTTTPAEGGYTVPRTFSDVLLEEIKQIGGVRNAAQLITTDSGNAIDWPTVDETAQVGEMLAENASATDQDVAFGTKALGVYKFSSKGVAVPVELLQDTGIDLEAYIRKALADRLARTTNTYATTGTGSSQPEGVVTGTTAGKTGTTGQTTTVIYDDLVDLIHSVDPGYRIGPNVGWMFNDSVLKTLRKLKDSQNRPLWQGGLTEDEPDNILGYRYTINQNMANMAANAKSILFGDFSKFIIRDVSEIWLYRFTDSAYAKKGQVGFLAMMRSGSAHIHATYNAIKHYANSAT
jgi:HK97 family phage major capsid protein